MEDRQIVRQIEAFISAHVVESPDQGSIRLMVTRYDDGTFDVHCGDVLLDVDHAGHLFDLLGAIAGGSINQIVDMLPDDLEV